MQGDNVPTRPLTAIGLMSGTSLDGIDAAILVSDGVRILDRGAAATIPYPPAFRERLRRLLGRLPDGDAAPVIDEMTDLHRAAVTALLDSAGIAASAIDVVGFHGQTVLHQPRARQTIQIGDGQRLADALGVAVIAEFRAADVAAGGEGAPLAPLYHLALARDLNRPLAVLNVGGVANVTWIGTRIGPGISAGDVPEVLAFDTGPGNALLDDWILRTTCAPYDADGELAGRGRIDAQRLRVWLEHPYFARRPPKSLDRDDFAAVLQSLHGIDAAAGAATLSAFTAQSLRAAMAFFPLRCGNGWSAVAAAITRR